LVLPSTYRFGRGTEKPGTLFSKVFKKVAELKIKLKLKVTIESGFKFTLFHEKSINLQGESRKLKAHDKEH
jgi:hypothetical protein